MARSTESSRSRSARRPRAGVLALVTAALAIAWLPAGQAQEDRRIGNDLDPVVGAVVISQESHDDGAASHAVVGRSDVFADNLAATALVGPQGTLLFTDGGSDAGLRPEVLAEVQRALGQGACEKGDSPDVFLVGGEAAVGPAVHQALAGAGYCVQRLAGPTRVETAIVIADAIAAPSGQVILARADDWADAAAVGAYAALTNSRLLVTPTDELLPQVGAAIERYAPSEILLMGGTAALSQAVEDTASQIAPVRRVAGAARDATAVAIAQDVWGNEASGNYAYGHGYAGLAWNYLFAAAPLAAQLRTPILYADDDGPTAVSQQALDAAQPEFTIPIGPPVPLDELVDEPPPPPTGDLDSAQVSLEDVAELNAPLAMQARPGTAELWIAERQGTIQAMGPGGTRRVLDINDTVSTDGERGLLGIAFSADGTLLYTSTTDNSGDSVLDEFAIVGDSVDEASRRQLMVVQQPASNHNGGDVQLGPDGMLWWSLGDGGGANDQFGTGQNTYSHLAKLLRIDPSGGDPYAIPPDNPWADGRAGVPEAWAWGLRNPFRFSFDSATGDLYIADVGQDRIEEVDYLPAGTGAGSNFGWSVFEGSSPFNDGDIQGHVPPIWETTHSAGNCSITGGTVYRGEAIPDLYGAYVYSDLCNSRLHAIKVENGQVVADADLGVSIGSPVGFGTDHDGEMYVISLGGSVAKLVPQ